MLVADYFADLLPLCGKLIDSTFYSFEQLLNVADVMGQGSPPLLQRLLLINHGQGCSRGGCHKGSTLAAGKQQSTTGNEGCGSAIAQPVHGLGLWGNWNSIKIPR